MERYGLGDTPGWNHSVLAWARGWNPLAWHARFAAVACAALVLANVTFAPANLWSLRVIAAWAVLLAAHAVAVVLAGRTPHGAPVGATTGVAAAAGPTVRPARADAAPLFSTDSPTVERPKRQPEHRAATERAPVEPSVGAMSIAPAPIGAATRSSVPAPPPVHAVVDPPLPSPVAPIGSEDMAIAVTVLPSPSDRAAPARIVPGQLNPRPALPERVVALWGGGGAPPAAVPADDWGHPAFASARWSSDGSAASAD